MTATPLAVHDPRTGDVVATHETPSDDELAGVLATAREAARWWGGLGFGQRRRHLAAFAEAIVDGLDDLAALIARENGKPYDDARLEVVLALEHLAWAGRNARRVLGRQRVRPGLASANQAASVGHEPYGVVVVLGPWNYPVYTPMGSIAHALAAGNAVVFKPSELTPGCARWLADRWLEAVPDQPVLQVVAGPGEVGERLVRSGPDKVAFTGSTATAKRVMATCAEALTPLVAECGGSDAMIVAADADLDAAARAALFGGMGNAGQTCAGVERVYVEAGVHDEFLAALAAAAADLPRPDEEGARYGPMTLSEQCETVATHVEDALRRGARAALGGPGSVRPPWIDPVVLADVPEDADAIREETFGPVVVVNCVDDLADAVARTNATPYGLSASVFSGSRRTAESVAARLRVGAVSINSVLGFAAVGALPFGGVGDSGFGRIHGAAGLREFARPKSVVRQRFPAPLDLLTMDRSPRDVDLAVRMARLRHG